MGREEGGEFRMGNTCIPVADSFRYLAKLIHGIKIAERNINNLRYADDTTLIMAESKN